MAEVGICAREDGEFIRFGLFLFPFFLFAKGKEFHIFLDGFVLPCVANFHTANGVAVCKFIKVLVNAFDGLDVKVDGEKEKGKPKGEKSHLGKDNHKLEPVVGGIGRCRERGGGGRDDDGDELGCAQKHARG